MVMCKMALFKFALTVKPLTTYVIAIYTTATHSRHIDRKLFKMRELRGAGRVTVKHIPGEENPADLFTKILSRQPFEKHRKFVLNTSGDAGIESSRQRRVGADASSQRHGTGAP